MSQSLLEKFQPSSTEELSKFLDGISPERKIQYAITSHLINTYPDSVRAETSAVSLDEGASINAMIEYFLENNPKSISGTLKRVSPSGIQLRTNEGKPLTNISYSTISSPADAPGPKVCGGPQQITKVTVGAEVIYQEAVSESATK